MGSDEPITRALLTQVAGSVTHEREAAVDDFYDDCANGANRPIESGEFMEKWSSNDVVGLI
jgi:hypothetical protein